MMRSNDWIADLPVQSGEPECWSMGVIECWKTQYSITRLWCQACT